MFFQILTMTIVVVTLLSEFILVFFIGPLVLWTLLRPSTSDSFYKDEIKRSEERMRIRREFTGATGKVREDQGMSLNEYILHLMQKNSDEFNQITGHQARIQFILETLEFKPEFGNEDLFQKAFVSAMNMYVPGEMKKRTGKGGLGMTYSNLSLNEKFTQAKEQRKMLSKV